jgi:uncharacterized SAM-binding protein YcdF (DUF218 family)
MGSRGEQPAKPRPKWRKRRIAGVGFLALVLAFAVATVPLFLLPARNSPRHVDAIIVLGGDGNRVGEGLKLAREGYASTLLLSRFQAQPCYRKLAGVDVECFRPEPFTTQGEARYIAAAVKQHGWKSVIVVTTPDQTSRARLRIKRCTDVDVAYVSTPLALSAWPRAIAYQWASLAKALVLQRSC